MNFFFVKKIYSFQKLKNSKQNIHSSFLFQRSNERLIKKQAHILYFRSQKCLYPNFLQKCSYFFHLVPQQQKKHPHKIHSTISMTDRSPFNNQIDQVQEVSSSIKNQIKLEEKTQSGHKQNQFPQNYDQSNGVQYEGQENQKYLSLKEKINENTKKPMKILEDNFDSWFFSQIQEMYQKIQPHQINHAKRSFIKHMYKKINLTIKPNQLEKQPQNQSQSQRIAPQIAEQEIEYEQIHKQQNDDFFSIEKQQEDMDQSTVEKIIKDNESIIKKQLKWQRSDECPPNQKLTYLRKCKQIIASFVFEGYGMASFKRHIVKKFLNQQESWEMFLSLVKDHNFYKKQSRPTIKKGFSQLENFLKKNNAFPNQTHGYVEIKDSENKFYTTPLLHCRSQFEPFISQLFIRLVSHIFNVKPSINSEKKQIGLSVEEAQVLYIKIIQKFYQRKKNDPKMEIKKLQKLLQDLNKKGQQKNNGSIQKKLVIPNRSMISNEKNCQSIEFFEKDEADEEAEILQNNSPMKAEIQKFYMQQFLLGKNLSQITQILSECLDKPIKNVYTLCLHQGCIREAMDYLKPIEKKFLNSKFFLNQYLKVNKKPNAQFMLKTIGLSHNMKFINWSPDFEEVRKRILLIFVQKMDGQEEIIQIWNLIEESYKKFRTNRQKGFVSLLDSSEFLFKKVSKKPIQNVFNKKINVQQFFSKNQKPSLKLTLQPSCLYSDFSFESLPIQQKKGEKNNFKEKNNFQNQELYFHGPHGPYQPEYFNLKGQNLKELQKRGHHFQSHNSQSIEGNFMQNQTRKSQFYGQDYHETAAYFFHPRNTSSFETIEKHGDHGRTKHFSPRWIENQEKGRICNHMPIQDEYTRNKFLECKVHDKIDFGYKEAYYPRQQTFRGYMNQTINYPLRPDHQMRHKEMYGFQQNRDSQIDEFSQKIAIYGQTLTSNYPIYRVNNNYSNPY